MCLRPQVLTFADSDTEDYENGASAVLPGAEHGTSPTSSTMSQMRRGSIIGELVLQDSTGPQSGNNLRQCSVVDALDDDDMIKTLTTFAIDDLNRLEQAFAAKDVSGTTPASGAPPPRHVGVHFPYFCLVLAVTLTLAFIISCAVHGFVPFKVC